MSGIYLFMQDAFRGFVLELELGINPLVDHMVHVGGLQAVILNPLNGFFIHAIRKDRNYGKQIIT